MNIQEELFGLADLQLVYRVLKYIYRNHEADEFDHEHFTADAFQTHPNRLNEVLRMLVEVGYITGIRLTTDSEDNLYISIGRPRLTPAGLFYLKMEKII